jgi:uncharacterized membrane protein YdbT with pleckstrin-like domain
MSYIDRNLLPDEQILFRTQKHLIIFLGPAILMILAYILYEYTHLRLPLGRLEWIIPLVSLVYFAAAWLEYITAEFIITNKRIIMREGFFTRHTQDLRINTISQINVEQSIIGQMLGYGNIALNAFGASDTFTTISHPLDFQRFANGELDKAAR